MYLYCTAYILNTTSIHKIKSKINHLVFFITLKKSYLGY